MSHSDLVMVVYGIGSVLGYNSHVLQPSHISVKIPRPVCDPAPIMLKHRHATYLQIQMAISNRLLMALLGGGHEFTPQPKRMQAKQGLLCDRFSHQYSQCAAIILLIRRTRVVMQPRVHCFIVFFLPYPRLPFGSEPPSNITVTPCKCIIHV